MNDESKPEPKVNSVTLAIGGIAIGIGATAAWLSGYWLMLVIVAVIALVCALVYFAWMRSRKSGKNSAFKRSFGEFWERLGQGRSQDESREIEILRRKFDALITEIETGKQDIYDVPWYLIIGPSGSGKSWVLKGGKLNPLAGEEVSVPGNKQSAKEGRGGTLLMDWWTSPDAIVLDTAGNMVIQEDEAMDSPEWNLLLSLLKKSRPEQPINGLLVVIPAPLLLLESKDLPKTMVDLQSYAATLQKRIREQLELGLGVRFPIYFIVTKSDKIPGFGQFVDEMEAQSPGQRRTDRRPRDQIFGWSNPVPIGTKAGSKGQSDDGFEPGRVVEYLKDVVEGVRKKRLALLGKYVGSTAADTDDDEELSQGQMGTQRRAAAIYTFARSIEHIGPKLAGFLEDVLAPDGKKHPYPFVRGIYFTSAMREGEEIDPLASRIGKLDLGALALPGEGERNITKTFFIKDLLFRKAFKEGGLVTPLVNTREYLRGRRRTMIWAGIGASAVLLLVVVVFMAEFKRRVGNTLRIWNGVASALEIPEKRFYPIIGGSQSLPGGLQPDNINEQLAIQESVVAREFKDGFAKAKAKVFEHGVVLPLATHADAKLARIAKGDEAAPENLEDGIIGLLELQQAWKTPKSASQWGVDLKRSLSHVGKLATFVDPGSGTNLAPKIQMLLENAFATDSSGVWPPGSSPLKDGIVDHAVDAMNAKTVAKMNTAGSTKSSLSTFLEEASGLMENERTLLEGFGTKSRSTLGLGTELANLRKQWETLSDQLRQAGPPQQRLGELTNLLQSTAESSARGFSNRVLTITGAVETNGLTTRFNGLVKRVSDNANVSIQKQAANLTGLLNDAPKIQQFLGPTKEGEFWKFDIETRIQEFQEILNTKLPTGATGFDLENSQQIQTAYNRIKPEKAFETKSKWGGADHREKLAARREWILANLLVTMWSNGLGERLPERRDSKGSNLSPRKVLKSTKDLLLKVTNQKKSRDALADLAPLRESQESLNSSKELIDGAEDKLVESFKRSLADYFRGENSPYNAYPLVEEATALLQRDNALELLEELANFGTDLGALDERTEFTKLKEIGNPEIKKAMSALNTIYRPGGDPSTRKLWVYTVASISKSDLQSKTPKAEQTAIAKEFTINNGTPIEYAVSSTVVQQAADRPFVLKVSGNRPGGEVRYPGGIEAGKFDKRWGMHRLYQAATPIDSGEARIAEFPVFDSVSKKDVGSIQLKITKKDAE